MLKDCKVKDRENVGYNFLNVWVYYPGVESCLLLRVLFKSTDFSNDLADVIPLKSIIPDAKLDKV